MRKRRSGQEDGAERARPSPQEQAEPDRNAFTLTGRAVGCAGRLGRLPRCLLWECGDGGRKKRTALSRKHETNRPNRPNTEGRTQPSSKRRKRTKQSRQVGRVVSGFSCGKQRKPTPAFSHVKTLEQRSEPSASLRPCARNDHRSEAVALRRGLSAERKGNERREGPEAARAGSLRKLAATSRGHSGRNPTRTIARVARSHFHDHPLEVKEVPCSCQRGRSMHQNSHSKLLRAKKL